MELFAKKFEEFISYELFSQKPILDVWQGPEFAILF